MIPRLKKKTAEPAPSRSPSAKTRTVRKQGKEPSAGRRKRDLRHVRAAEPKSEAEKASAQEARTLSGKAARYLRGLGHHLDPVIQIGKDGITDGLVAATRAALLAHELVKVKVLAEAPVDRKLAGQELADRAGAALAQTLGRTLLLYKRHPHKPKIALPR
jgi:RNA-binding protein